MAMTTERTSRRKLRRVGDTAEDCVASNHWARAAAGVAVALLISALSTRAAVVHEPLSVDGLALETASTNILLTWPSCAGETFVILWRSNAILEAPWIVLTNQLPASSQEHRTSFCDTGVINRAPHVPKSTELTTLYRVFVIPDFWFDMEGVIFVGGPRNPEEDFLPFYYGSTETGICKPQMELLVDGISAGVGSTLGEDIQKVNFGTLDKPQWGCAAGFWFDHGNLSSGEHSLQLTTLLQLNNFVGDWSWSVTLTNKPVRVRVITLRIDKEAKGSQRLLEIGRAQAGISWWKQRLGPRFVRKRPSPEEDAEHFIHSPPHPLESRIAPRPLNFTSAPEHNGPSQP